MREEVGAEGTRGGRIKGAGLGKRGGRNRVRGRARCEHREGGPT